MEFFSKNKIDDNEMEPHEQKIHDRRYGLCPECNRPNTFKNWCKICYSKKFQQNFENWTSGNKQIDKLIQESQLNARNGYELLEWIPYDRLRNIKFLAQGGFSTVYEAIWLDGNIQCWDYEKQDWKRNTYKLEQNIKSTNYSQTNVVLKNNEKYGYKLALKSLNDSSNRNEDFLNEWKLHLQCQREAFSNNTLLIPVLGIIQDPDTLNYMIALHITSANEPIIKNEIYGVLPYMAPEVLRGKPYTKAFDIYSFGIIIGARPEIVEETMPEYVELMKRCWDNDPEGRPAVNELKYIFHEWKQKYQMKNDKEKRIPIPENKAEIINHPKSCYTSRRIDYSAKLN
ncbi:hypothetical protein RclHR1_01310015 [Rhizophagus clarus]|uniref:Kinase-like domain-containing protein n=1 Tax=Rhizophagus clarus TaxID=94130 RepID=A0A2Z6QLP3_9GLOM|nr:hypothetical protein RclHR1_01310015 [Rhizophagus clarus]GES91788.1 kinase-like domain-containing protein [Rhizophagus clarus]